MDVLMEDGTTISDVPDDITKSELLRRYTKHTAKEMLGGDGLATQAAQGFKNAVNAPWQDIGKNIANWWDNPEAWNPTKEMADIAKQARTEGPSTPMQHLQDAAAFGNTLASGLMGMGAGIVGGVTHLDDDPLGHAKEYMQKVMKDTTFIDPATSLGKTAQFLVTAPFMGEVNGLAMASNALHQAFISDHGRAPTQKESDSLMDKWNTFYSIAVGTLGVAKGARAQHIEKQRSMTEQRLNDQVRAEKQKIADQNGQVPFEQRTQGELDLNNPNIKTPEQIALDEANAVGRFDGDLLSPENMAREDANRASHQERVTTADQVEQAYIQREEQQKAESASEEEFRRQQAEQDRREAEILSQVRGVDNRGRVDPTTGRNPYVEGMMQSLRGEKDTATRTDNPYGSETVNLGNGIPVDPKVLDKLPDELDKLPFMVGGNSTLEQFTKDSKYTSKVLGRLPQKLSEIPISRIRQELSRDDITGAEKRAFSAILEDSSSHISPEELVNRFKLHTNDFKLTPRDSHEYAEYGFSMIDPEGKRIQDTVQTTPVTTQYELPESMRLPHMSGNHFRNPRLFGWTRKFMEDDVRHILEVQTDLHRLSKPDLDKLEKQKAELADINKIIAYLSKNPIKSSMYNRARNQRMFQYVYNEIKSSANYLQRPPMAGGSGYTQEKAWSVAVNRTIAGLGISKDLLSKDIQTINSVKKISEISKFWPQRLIQEELRDAFNKGEKVVRFPTLDTEFEIQGWDGPMEGGVFDKYQTPYNHYKDKIIPYLKHLGSKEVTDPHGYTWLEVSTEANKTLVNMFPGQRGSISPDLLGIPKLLSLIERKKAPKNPEVVDRLLSNRVPAARKEQTYESLKGELFDAEGAPKMEDAGYYQPAINFFQPGMYREHPITRWVQGKLMKAAQEAASEFTRLMYAPKLVGFHKYRLIPNYEHTAEGGVTNFLALGKKDPEAAMKAFRVAEKFTGVKNFTYEDLIKEGLTPEQANAIMPIRKMLQETYKMISDAGFKFPEKLGYLPKSRSGNFWVKAVRKSDGARIEMAIPNKWTSLPFNKDDYYVTISKIDRTNVLSELDMGNFIHMLSDLDARKALEGEFKGLIDTRGFRSHSMKQTGVLGYLGSLEDTPQQQFQGTVQGIEMYMRSATRWLSRQGPSKEVNKFLYDKDMEKAYRNAANQGQRDWALGSGDLSTVTQMLDGSVDWALGGLGFSVDTARSTIRGLGHIGNKVRVLVGNFPNLLANKLQSFVSSPSSFAEYGLSTITPVGLGAKDYFTLRNNKELHAFITEMEKRGAISNNMTKELEDPARYTNTMHDNIIKWGEEVTLEGESKRTELQSRIQAALMARRALLQENERRVKSKEPLLSKEDILAYSEHLVKQTMGDYDRSGKAPVITSTGLLGDTLNALSTFMINETNKTLQYGKGSLTGNNKANNFKAFLHNTAMWLAVGGAATSVIVKMLDLATTIRNHFESDEKPMTLVSDRIMSDDSIPEIVRIGFVSKVLGMNVQNAMQQSFSFGGIGGSGMPFPLDYARKTADAASNMGADYYDFGKQTPDTRRKMERVLPQTLSGISDYLRTRENNNLATNDKGGTYQRTDMENLIRMTGARSNKEMIQMSKDRARANEITNRSTAMSNAMKNILREYKGTGDISDKAAEKYVEMGGEVPHILSTIKQYEEAINTTTEERFLSNLNNMEKIYLQDLEDRKLR